MIDKDKKIKALRELRSAMIENGFKIAAGYDGDMYLVFNETGEEIELEGWDNKINEEKIYSEICKLEAKS